MAIDNETALSTSAERYLEAIFRLSDSNPYVAVSDMAKFLSVSPASVSEMVKKLAEGGYVEHKPYHGVKLLAEGRKVGGEAVRRHRLAERLLTDLLGAPPERAHEEAERLEGFLRGEIENRVMEVLGYPETCPHGNPLNVGEVENAILLSEIQDEQERKIAKIRYETSDFLNYLKTANLIPGSMVAIQGREPYGGPVILRVNGTEQRVGEPVLSKVWVFPLDSDQE